MWNAPVSIPPARPSVHTLLGGLRRVIASLIELHDQTTARTNWTAYWFGYLAGTVAWIALAWQVFAGTLQPA